MMLRRLLVGIAHAFALTALFLLPWQTRYIVWSPTVGTSLSEFGVVSVYVTALLAWCSATLFLGDRILARKMSWQTVVKVGGVWGVGGGVFLLVHPSPLAAWILHVYSALALGYATYSAVHISRRHVLLALLAGLVPSALLGAWQTLVGSSPASTWLGLASRNAAQLGDAVLTTGGTRILRMYGSFPHPNIFGTALALMAAMCVSLFPEKISKQKVIAKVIGIATLLFMLLCISRSAALAIVCAGIAAYGLRQKNKKYIVLAFLFPVGVWMLQFIAPGLLALRGQSFTEQRSIAERVAQVNEWWQVMKVHGMWGAGMYQYPAALAGVHGAPLPAWAYQPVHNVLLLVIAELGALKSLLGIFSIGIMSGLARKKMYAYLPLFACVWSLAWFDHALWTSWAGMAYAAVGLTLVFAGEQRKISTLGIRVLDERG